MKGLRLRPRDDLERYSNWRLVSRNVPLLGGRLGGTELTGGTQSGEDLTLRSNPSLDGSVKLDLATEDLEFIDAGTTGATEQAWAEVKVNGVTGYVWVRATK